MILFTEFYKDNKDVQIKKLETNLNNQFIKKVVVFVDDLTQNLIYHPKAMKINRKISSLFDKVKFANTFVNSEICIISNEQFDNSVANLIGYDLKNKLLVIENKTQVFRSSSDIGKIFRNIENNDKIFTPNVTQPTQQLETKFPTEKIKKLDILIVSVNYTDFLSITLKENIKFIDKSYFHVVTSSFDLECQNLCSELDIDCIITDAFYQNGDPFNKGRAINYAISKLIEPDWILLLDADIILRGPLNLDLLEKDSLYSAKRTLIKTYGDYMNRNEVKLPKEDFLGFGYFQLFNYNSKNVDQNMIYSEVSKNASRSDVIFKKRFSRILDIGVEVYHLGETRKNWNGRVTGQFISLDNSFKLNKTNFTIAVVYYNPYNDKNIKNNFYKFLDQFEFCKDSIFVAYVDYGQDELVLPFRNIKVKGDVNRVFWAKEILLNKILEFVETDYFIWIDADIIFDNFDWLNELDLYLPENTFCQLFSKVKYLDDKNNIESEKSSLISELIKQRTESNFNKVLSKGFSPGIGWVTRTEYLKSIKFFEKMIVGGGDTIFLIGILKFKYSNFLLQIQKINESLYNKIIDWMDSFGAYNVNFINQSVNHLWHGKISNRKYSERNLLLSEDTDAKSINDYFKQRVCVYEPLVTVIIVNFNCADYIDRAIKSVLNQTYKNFELLIIDNDSSDDSLDRITKYSKDKRVSVYRVDSNPGPYWSKNSLIMRCNGEFITMLDSDDYDDSRKLESQINTFNQNKDISMVSCSYQRENEKPSFGWPSMMWKKSVFDDIGYYDSIKFGADSEFFERFINFYGKHKTIHINEVLQFGTRRENGLTSIVPEKSNIRKKYIEKYKDWHSRAEKLYVDFSNKKRHFDVDERMIIDCKVDLYNIKKIESESSILPVIMCVWKRIDGFRNIINQLNSQTFKNFKLFIWNNNPDLIYEFESILMDVNFNYEMYNSDKNIGGFGRFYFASKIRRRPNLIDHCVFIDDDQTFGDEALQVLYDEREDYTIKSQWGWKFSGCDYYRDRVLAKPGEEIHYAGTGGMIVDMRVFEDERLFDCPQDYWFVEDLWLSYFANKFHNYSLIKSAVKIKNGDDTHSLYKVVKDLKTPMLVDLIQNRNWQII